jgi:hypothetical protein
MLHIKSQLKTLFLLFLSLSLVIPLYSFSGGDGSNLDPYQISTCTQLQNMSSNLGANYTLNSDIDCSGIANFDPIGYCVGTCYPGDLSDIPYTGNFYGKNFTISNLNIVNTSTSDNGWGLFGYINNSNISDVNLNNVFLNISSSDVGGLVGNSWYSSYIVNSSSIGIIVGIDNVGGLVGTSWYSGPILNSYSTGSITGNNYVGGLVGYKYHADFSPDIFDFSSSISNSYSSADVSGLDYVGGLVGYIWMSTIYNSSFSGSISGNDEVGGLIGFSAYTATHISSSRGSISGNDDIGGLIGRSLNFKGLYNSTSSSSVTGNNNIGGLVGYSHHTAGISNSYSTGNVTGNTSIGGLVGLNIDTTSGQRTYIYNSYSTSNVIGSSQVGGLVGTVGMRSYINYTYFAGRVIGNSSVGGLIGGNYQGFSELRNSFFIGSVEGNFTVGSIAGDYISGPSSNLFWNNNSDNVNNTFGSGSTNGITTIQDNISRFYGNSFLPTSNWDSAIWDFYNTTLPHLAFENYVVVSTPAPSSVSSASLPSLSFYAVVLSLIGIILFLF